MKIEYENTIDDIVSFNLYIFNNSPGMKRSRRIITYSFPILWFFIMVLPEISSDIILYEILAWLILSVPWILLVPYIYKWSTIKNVKRLYSEGENKGTVGKHTTELKPDSLDDETDYGEFRQQWNAVNKIETDDNYILLFTSSVAAHIIPKRYFGSNFEIESFVKEVQKFIDKNRV